MAWITAKTTWSEVDYYNYGDLNRVENNTDYIADLIESFATRPSVSTIKTDWTVSDFVFYDDLNRAESNIDYIRVAMATPTNWEACVTDWESLDIFDYSDANRLEKNLVLLKIMADNINDAFLHCGEFYCGELTLL